MFAFPPFIFYWQRDGSQLSKLFTTCWGLQLQFENISYFFTCRWFPKSWWVLTCIKILKNNLNDFFSNRSSCTLTTWILCRHSKVKSPALHLCSQSSMQRPQPTVFYQQAKNGHGHSTSLRHCVSKGCLVRQYHSDCTRGHQQFVLQNSEVQHMAGWGFCPGYPNTGAVRKHFSIFVLFPLSAYLSSLKIL